MTKLEMAVARLRNGLGSLAAVLFSLVLGVASVQAAETQPPDAARQFLQNFGERTVTALGDPGLSPREREGAVGELIRAGFELETIGRLVLGRHWKAASEDQRAEFHALFESYVVVTTVRRLSGYAGEVLTVGPARPAGDSGLVTVASSIVTRSGSNVALDWRLRETGGAWRVIDVVVEGVSMLQTQRAEFDSVIRRSGGNLDGLLSKLRSLVAA